MKINKKGLELIKRFEGTGPMEKGQCKPYLCPANVPTIGYGSTVYANGVPVSLKDSPIPLTEAENLLTKTMSKYEEAVTKMVKVPLSENQFSALVSFVYNLGAGNLQQSTLLKKLNARDFFGAADEFMKWNKVKQKGVFVVLKGLDDRRRAERTLFMTK